MAKIYTTSHKLITIISAAEVEKDYTLQERKTFEGYTHEPHIIEFTVLVSKIGNNAFKNSKHIASVVFSDSVVKLGDSAFEDCVKLEQINLNNIKVLGNNTFKNCRSLKYVDFGLVTEISECCFEKCVKLEDITGFNKITSINKYAFKNCKSLTNLILSDNLSYINEFSFVDCDIILTINESLFENLRPNVQNVTFKKVLSTNISDNDYLTEFITRRDLFNNTDILNLVDVELDNVTEQDLKELCLLLKQLQKTKNKLNTLITKYNSF